jgi:hypothetical protein
MSKEQPLSLEGNAYYDLLDVFDDEGLARACEGLEEHGVHVEYGATVLGNTHGDKGIKEVKVSPPIPKEEMGRLGNLLGLQIVPAT